jgi:AP-1 complex subunit beta-1
LLTSPLPLRYASEVDVDFVRKAVRAVGQVAIKIDTAAERCVGVLMDLIETRVSYVVQEAVIVLKVSGPTPIAGERNLVSGQLRRIMGRILISTSRTSSGDTLTVTRASSRRCAPTSTSSLIWIIGEYAEKIENADELLGTFLEAFKEESYPVSRDW